MDIKTADVDTEDELTSELLKAQRQVEQAKARYKSLVAKQTAERKKLAETRQKILGDLLIKAAQKDDRYNRVIKVLLDSIPEGKRHKAFNNWEVPQPQ
ncbi:MAG: hypothetical protein ABF461_04160 [Zymomonas mobilis subsp. pomaceae]|nr:hypothetical protein [Zymomonas mobilis]MDX5949311.1 hypothetical protein [Zymomonas mobilis subsp. pomaceae]GEB89682.1 hypothetical protein ZMO02_13190 [Zymomonas mobilis subsp. pomaceae]